MMSHLRLITLSLGLILILSPIPSLNLSAPAMAAAQYVEVGRIPNLLGLRQGDRIRTDGLAQGEMRFTALTQTSIQMQQQMTLNGFARKAIEQVLGKSLSSRSNAVSFRFVVRQQAGGGFYYSLYDHGNNQLLMEGPVKVKTMSGRQGGPQHLVFEAVLVRMNVTIHKQRGRVHGQATFALGIVPVPGSLGFVKL